LYDYIYVKFPIARSARCRAATKFAFQIESSNIKLQFPANCIFRVARVIKAQKDCVHMLSVDRSAGAQRPSPAFKFVQSGKVARIWHGLCAPGCIITRDARTHTRAQA